MRRAAAPAAARCQRRRYVSAEQLTIRREKHFHLARFGDSVEAYAGMEPTRRTVQEQLAFGNRVMENKELLIESARFLQTEMLIRLARTIRSFQNLPYIVGINPKIQDVYVKCWDWFVTLFQYTDEHGQVTDASSEEAYTKHLLRVFEDHGNIVHLLRQGIADVRDLPSSNSVDFAYVDAFITQFILRRISWRVLAETHLALKTPKGVRFNGIFNLHCKPADIGRDALFMAQYICETELCEAPSFAIKGDTEATFEYIDEHLRYVLHELAKNSMRATVNHFRGRVMPKVVLRVCSGDDITISIHDRGGGIPLDIAENIWNYGFTTVEEKKREKANAYFPDMAEKVDVDVEAQEGEKALAGWGFGLPLS
eukprot:gene15180-23188_t